MQVHTITTCPFHMNATYVCEDTQFSEIPKDSRQRTAFICGKHSTSDMPARSTENTSKRPQMAPQQKEKRNHGKVALAATCSDNGGSFLAAHVTHATICWTISLNSPGPFTPVLWL